MKATAPTHSYSLPQLPGMLALAEIAVQLVRAEQARDAARAAYHERIRQFEKWHGRLQERLDPRNPKHKAVVVYSEEHYSKYCAAKRQVYNIKRRLQTAVRRLSVSGT